MYVCTCMCHDGCECDGCNCESCNQWHVVLAACAVVCLPVFSCYGAMLHRFNHHGVSALWTTHTCSDLWVWEFSVKPFQAHPQPKRLTVHTCIVFGLVCCLGFGGEGFH